jgi:hypothetical protein
MGRPSADFEFNAAFEVNSAKPLDTRTVVDYYTDLSNLTYAYEGLLVYVKNDTEVSSVTYSAGYYFYDGTNWSKFETGGEPKPYEYPKITSFTSTYSGEKEEGLSYAYTTLTIEVTRGSADIKDIKFYIDGSLVSTITENVASGGTFTYLYEPSGGISTDKVFGAKVTDDNDCVVDAGDMTLDFVSYVYLEPKYYPGTAAPDSSSAIKNSGYKRVYSTNVNLGDTRRLQYGAYISCEDGYEPMIRTNFSDNLVFTQGNMVAYNVSGDIYKPYVVWTTNSVEYNNSTYESINFKTCTKRYSAPKIEGGIGGHQGGTSYPYNIYEIKPSGGLNTVFSSATMKINGDYLIPLYEGGDENPTFRFTWDNYKNMYNSPWKYLTINDLSIEYTDALSSGTAVNKRFVPYMLFGRSESKLNSVSAINSFLSSQGTKLLYFPEFKYSSIFPANRFTDTDWFYIKVISYYSVSFSAVTMSTDRGNLTGTRIDNTTREFHLEGGSSRSLLISSIVFTDGDNHF